MTDGELLPPAVLKRKAVVYVRQSTQAQVQIHLESQRRQYELVDEARRRGFRDVEVIDDDLGRSASGAVARPGFEKLVAWLCAGEVGAVLCFDASRLARNGRDWHHLLELCGLVEARVIDLDGVYNPCRPNDRLLARDEGQHQRVRAGHPACEDAGRRPFEGAAGRTEDFRPHRLPVASRDRIGLRSRREGPGGHQTDLQSLPAAWQRSAGASVAQVRGHPLSPPLGRQEDDLVRVGADPLPQCHCGAQEPLLRGRLRLR